MQAETIRLFELASQIHTSSESLLALAHRLGMPVKSKMSKLSLDQATALRDATASGLPTLPQAATASLSVAEDRANEAARKGEAAEQAKEMAWLAKMEKIKAELKAANQEQPSHQ